MTSAPAGKRRSPGIRRRQDAAEEPVATPGVRAIASPGSAEPAESQEQGRTDSREALVAAARLLFSEHGYDRTTMRAVAGRAHVDPALIYHYFPGGKQALLAETLTLPSSLARQMAGVAAHPDEAGQELVRRALHAWDAYPEVRQQGAALMRIAVASETAGELLGPAVRAFVLGVVGDALRADHRDLRAGLVLAQVQGMLLHRYVLRLPPLADAHPEQLVATIGPVVQHYITGDLGSVADPAG